MLVVALVAQSQPALGGASSGTRPDAGASATAGVDGSGGGSRSEGSTRTPESAVECAAIVATYPCHSLEMGDTPDCVTPGTLEADAPCLYGTQCASPLLRERSRRSRPRPVRSLRPGRRAWWQLRLRHALPSASALCRQSLRGRPGRRVVADRARSARRAVRARRWLPGGAVVSRRPPAGVHARGRCATRLPPDAGPRRSVRPPLGRAGRVLPGACVHPGRVLRSQRDLQARACSSRAKPATSQTPTASPARSARWARARSIPRRARLPWRAPSSHRRALWPRRPGRAAELAFGGRLRERLLGLAVQHGSKRASRGLVPALAVLAAGATPSSW